MKFIELTYKYDSNNRKVYVNFENVISFHELPGNGGTKVNFIDGRHVIVLEPVKDIKERLATVCRCKVN